MKPRKEEQREAEVFILGFSGAEIYYSASEHRVFSCLNAALTSSTCTESDSTAEDPFGLESE